VTFKEHIPAGQREQPILEPSLGEAPLWEHTRVVGLFDATVDTQQVDQYLAQQFPDTHSLVLQWEQLEDKDWEREWMKNYHPIQCADQLWICPSWIDPPAPNAVNLLLDPGLAFGTGTHPTTFLCLQWLAEQSLDGQSVVDYGCGSGILGVAALLLGATSATGIDIDPQALIATQDNVERNGLDSKRFPVYLPKDCPPLNTQLLLANILAGPLAELADKLVETLAPGGRICLSGILHHQADAVMRAYADHIIFDPIAQKEEWVRLTGYKPAPTISA